MKKKFVDQPLKIYNSLTGEKELFQPILPSQVGMYLCGPTVYDQVHLGNCRTFICFDVIFRYLLHLGYSVRYVRNITDVGHLENDFQEGEDKISKRAKYEKLEPMEIAQKYTLNFHHVLNCFNTLPPSIEPRASGHILEQIELIKILLHNKLAYEVQGSIYFDLKQYTTKHSYGILSRRNTEDLISHTRELKGQKEKKNPQDFALWKKAPLKHIMRWNSPWGEGFPGWHLECTAMSSKYLGGQFDIHGGGIDLKFPHHECELAQSQGAFRKPPANYWVHANMLTFDGQKMSKSTGNFLLPLDIFTGGSPLLTKEFDPMVVRFFLLQAHYRSVLDFSNAALMAAQKGYDRLMSAFKQLEEIKATESRNFNLSAWIDDCYEKMNDDFNTPRLIANLFKVPQLILEIHKGKASLNASDLALLKDSMKKFLFDVLGLENKTKNQKEDTQILQDLKVFLTDLRAQARLDKYWNFSDQIRDKLAQLNVMTKDDKIDHPR